MTTRERPKVRDRRREIAREMRAALRVFQSRRPRVCYACGAVLLSGDELVRVRERVFHRECAQADRLAR